MNASEVKAWKDTIENPNAIRTTLQNKCLHKGLRSIADELNASGQDMRKVLKEGVEIPWTMESVKEFMFNPIAEVMFDGRTSSDLSTTEIQQVWDVLNRHTGEKCGVTVAWPDRHGGGE